MGYKLDRKIVKAAKSEDWMSGGMEVSQINNSNNSETPQTQQIDKNLSTIQPFNPSTNKSYSSKKAFTLAEVLITLGVIGVVAAMTLPTLIKKYDEMVTVNRVKQAYSTFSQAYLRAQEANDSILYWDIGRENTDDGAKKLYDYFKPYMHKVKDCDKAHLGCFAENYKALFTEQPYIYQPNSANSKYAGGVLKNGVVFGFWSNGTGCKKSAYGDYYACGNIKFDINGKKGPNRAGKDYFNFIISNTGIKASYVIKDNKDSKYKEFCQYNDPSKYNGVACTGWIINNGNMDYLRRDVSGE